MIKGQLTTIFPFKEKIHLFELTSEIKQLLNQNTAAKLMDPLSTLEESTK